MKYRNKLCLYSLSLFYYIWSPCLTSMSVFFCSPLHTRRKLNIKPVNGKSHCSVAKYTIIVSLIAFPSLKEERGITQYKNITVLSCKMWLRLLIWASIIIERSYKTVNYRSMCQDILVRFIQFLAVSVRLIVLCKANFVVLANF